MTMKGLRIKKQWASSVITVRHDLRKSTKKKLIIRQLIRIK